MSAEAFFAAETSLAGDGSQSMLLQKGAAAIMVRRDSWVNDLAVHIGQCSFSALYWNAQ